MTTHKTLKMVKFKTHYNHRDVVSKGEPGGGKSLTEPDQHMTVRQLYDRYSRNQSLGGRVLSVIYDGDDDDDDGINPAILDLVEVQERKEQYLEEIEERKQSIRDRRKAKREATSGPSAANPISLEKSPAEPKKRKTAGERFKDLMKALDEEEKSTDTP